MFGEKVNLNVNDKCSYMLTPNLRATTELSMTTTLYDKNTEYNGSFTVTNGTSLSGGFSISDAMHSIDFDVCLESRTVWGANRIV